MGAPSYSIVGTIRDSSSGDRLLARFRVAWAWTKRPSRRTEPINLGQKNERPSRSGGGNLADCRLECREGDRLGQMDVKASLQTLLDVLLRGVAADCDTWDVA